MHPSPLRDSVWRIQARVAVVAEDGSLTYGELESRANRLARHLVVLGVGREAGGCEPSPDYGYGGGSARDLESRRRISATGSGSPAERLAYMLEDSGASVLVTHGDVLDSFPAFEGGVVCLDRDREKLKSLSDEQTEVEVDPDQLAYVIYTSGSTGRPKGVEVSHGNAVGFLLGIMEKPGFSADDVLLAVANLSFDTSVDELFRTPERGRSVVLASREELEDGHRLLTLLEESGINLIDCTPATWRLLFDSGWTGNRTCGHRRWRSAAPGPSPGAGKPDVVRPGTRTVPPREPWPQPRGDTDDVDQIRIGTPLPNYQVRVLDSRMRPVPVGVPGELHIGGVGVSRGYGTVPS